MLDQLTADSFAPYIGHAFQIHYGAGNTVNVILADVQRSPYNQPNDEGRRQGFSLLFHSTIRDHLPQGTYQITEPVFNAAYGDLTLFLVPLAPNVEGVRYEAVFN